ncbi:MAG: aminotransferase class IV [Chloroflexi bacterium]|nr:aminotransferase class IV [Chloroflexota bacterium]
MGIYYIDGEYVDESDALLPVTDLAVLRGYGVFDFTRTYGGMPFKLNEHLVRLRRSASQIELPIPLDDDEIAEIVLQTVRRNGYPEAGVRIVYTGGESDDGLTPADRPRLLVLVTPLRRVNPASYLNGVKIISEPLDRYLPEAKTLNYIPAIKALRRGAKSGAIEAVYVNREGYVLEGTTSNLFAFIGDTLVTPAVEVLNGITRHVVLDVARGHFTIEERPIALTELYKADEVFLSASNKQVMPVVEVDDETIADGRPGSRTRRVMGLFAAYTGEPIPGMLLAPEQA